MTEDELNKRSTEIVRCLRDLGFHHAQKEVDDIIQELHPNSASTDDHQFCYNSQIEVECNFWGLFQIKFKQFVHLRFWQVMFAILFIIPFAIVFAIFIVTATSAISGLELMPNSTVNDVGASNPHQRFPTLENGAGSKSTTQQADEKLLKYSGINKPFPMLSTFPLNHLLADAKLKFMQSNFIQLKSSLEITRLHRSIGAWFPRFGSWWFF